MPAERHGEGNPRVALLRFVRTSTSRFRNSSPSRGRGAAPRAPGLSGRHRPGRGGVGLLRTPLPACVRGHRQDAGVHAEERHALVDAIVGEGGGAHILGGASYFGRLPATSHGQETEKLSKDPQFLDKGPRRRRALNPAARPVGLCVGSQGPDPQAVPARADPADAARDTRARDP